MHKIMGVLLLGIVSSGAAAEWLPFGHSADGSFDIFVDPATISRDGNVATMWHMNDYKSVRVLSSGRQYLSSRTQREYDCRDERSRVLQFAFHAGRMASGKVVHADGGMSDDWKPIIPGSVDDNNWKLACS